MANKVSDNISKPLYILENEDDPHGSTIKGVYPETTIDQVFDQLSASNKSLRTILEELRKSIEDGGIGNIVFPVTSVNGKQGDVNITLKSLGLDKIDLTPDKDKPLSEPQRTAIEEILKNYDFDSDVQDALDKHLQDSNNPHHVTFDQINADNAVDELISLYLSRHNTSTSEDTHRDIRNRLSKIENQEEEHINNVTNRVDNLYKRIVAHQNDQNAHSALFDEKEDVKNKSRSMMNYDHTSYPTTRAVAEYVISKINDLKGSINNVDEWIQDIKVVESESDLPKASSKFFRTAYVIVRGPDHKQELAICRKTGGNNESHNPQSWIIKDGSPITEEKIQELLDSLENDYDDDTEYNGSVPYPFDKTNNDESSGESSYTDNQTAYELGHNKFTYNPVTGELLFTYDEGDGDPEFTITNNGILQVTYDEYSSISDTVENIYFAVNNDDLTLIMNEVNDQCYWEISSLGAYTVFDPQYFYNGVNGLTLNESNVGKILTEMAGQYNSYDNGANKFYYNEETGALSFIYDESYGDCEMSINDNGEIVATYDGDSELAETLDNVSFDIKADSLLLVVQDSNPLTDMIEDMFKTESALLLSDYYTKDEIDKYHYINGINIITGTQDGMIRYYINNDQSTMSEDIPVAGLKKLAFLDQITENDIAPNAITSEAIGNKVVEERNLADKAVTARSMKASYGNMFANVNDENGNTVTEVPISEIGKLIKPTIQEVVNDAISDLANSIYDRLEDRFRDLIREEIKRDHDIEPENAWSYDESSGILQFTYNEDYGTPAFNLNSNGEMEATYNNGDSIGSVLERSSFNIVNDELLLNVS